MSPRLLALSALLIYLIIPTIGISQTVTLQHNGLVLNAELEKTDSFSEGPVILMTHGTLAHSKMEIMSTLQSLLKDEGISSLSINLSLGLSNRQGMYDCAVTHKHTHEDAMTEIGLWHNFLHKQGAGKVVALGHSRGGNQTAQYAQDAKAGSLSSVVLIAPMIWDPAKEARNYKKRYGSALEPILDKAQKMQPNQILSEVDFIYCPKTSAAAKSFDSYYKDTPSKHTPNLLSSMSSPTLVITGSEDQVVSHLPKALTSLGPIDGVSIIAIDGADHFFRDLYADEVVEEILDFIN